MRRIGLVIWVLLLLAAGAVRPVWAEPQAVAISFSHAAPGVGEETFLYAVPKRMGWFAAEGLQVRGVFAPNVITAAQALQSGSVQFATTTADVILGLREQGGTVRAVMGLRRSNGHAVAVLAESPLRSLEDLKGRTLGSVEWASMAGLYLGASLEEIGIKPGDYRRVTTGAGPAAAAALRSGQVDGLALWDAMFAAMENHGLALRYIDIPVAGELANYSLASTDAVVARDPALVRGFCRAVVKAMVFTRARPEDALTLLLAEYPQLLPPGEDRAEVVRRDRHILDRYMGNTLQGLDAEAPIGTIDPAVWQRTEAFFGGLGRLKGSVKAAEGFTTAFVPACNDFDRAAVLHAAMPAP